jgi:kynureninase
MDNLLIKAGEYDEQDELKSFRNQFFIPKDKEGNDLIYLCGNSLGLQPNTVKPAVENVLDSWAKNGVEGHTDGEFPWLPYHEFLTENMANVVGARPSETIVMNSLTVNLHLMMVSFYTPVPGKHKILVESGLFPSDQYAVASQIRFHGYDPEDSIVYLKGANDFVSDADIEACFAENGDNIALVMIGGVNYYSGQYYNLPLITRLAKQYGCKIGFDLAHGAGNIVPDLHELGADFAVWCTYKYLNSGPGALAGAFIHSNHEDWDSKPRFEGWWGNNKEKRFKMEDQFLPLRGAEGWQLSNPPIMAMAPIRASLEIFKDAGMNRLRAKGKKLSSFLIECLQELDAANLEIITPLDPDKRGCQVSIRLLNPDKQLFNALLAAGVIADWREPDVIRVAPVPLYNTFQDIFRFYELLKKNI